MTWMKTNILYIKTKTKTKRKKGGCSCCKTLGTCAEAHIKVLLLNKKSFYLMGYIPRNEFCTDSNVGLFFFKAEVHFEG